MSSAIFAHKGQEIDPGVAHFILMDRSGLFGVSFDAAQPSKRIQGPISAYLYSGMLPLGVGCKYVEWFGALTSDMRACPL